MPSVPTVSGMARRNRKASAHASKKPVVTDIRWDSAKMGSSRGEGDAPEKSTTATAARIATLNAKNAKEEKMKTENPLCADMSLFANIQLFKAETHMKQSIGRALNAA